MNGQGGLAGLFDLLRRPLVEQPADAGRVRRPASGLQPGRGEKPIKSGAKVGRRGRCAVSQRNEVAIPRDFLAGVLPRVAELRPPPVASTA